MQDVEALCSPPGQSGGSLQAPRGWILLEIIRAAFYLDDDGQKNYPFHTPLLLIHATVSTLKSQIMGKYEWVPVTRPVELCEAAFVRSGRSPAALTRRLNRWLEAHRACSHGDFFFFGVFILKAS